MRQNRVLSAICRARDAVEHELTSRLLMAAMLIPLVEALFGWRAHTPLDVPLAVHASILLTLVAVDVYVTAHERDESRMPRGVRWLPVPFFAVMLAVVLNTRSNIFYTGRALIEGMAVLLIIHFVGRSLRQRALTRHRVVLVSPVSPHTARLRDRWQERTSIVVARRAPAVRLADTLTTVVGWSLLLAWTLIALEHRHLVGPILIAAGLLDFIALVVLIPDALPYSRLTAWAEDLRFPRRPQSVHLDVVRGDAPLPVPFFGPHHRRRS